MKFMALSKNSIFKTLSRVLDKCMFMESINENSTNLYVYNQ